MDIVDDEEDAPAPPLRASSAWCSVTERRKGETLHSFFDKVQMASLYPSTNDGNHHRILPSYRVSTSGMDWVSLRLTVDCNLPI